MPEKTQQKIAEIQNQIITTEEKITECIKLEYNTGIRKLVHQLEMDLKYLSVLANGAPVNKEKDMKVMDFLRIHYNRLRDYPIPAKSG